MDREKMMGTVERVLLNNGAEVRALGVVSQIVDAIIAEHLTPTEQKKARDDLVTFGNCVVMVMADGTTRHVPLDEFYDILRARSTKHERTVSELIKGVRNASKSSGDDQS